MNKAKCNLITQRWFSIHFLLTFDLQSSTILLWFSKRWFFVRMIWIMMSESRYPTGEPIVSYFKCFDIHSTVRISSYSSIIIIRFMKVERNINENQSNINCDARPLFTNWNFINEYPFRLECQEEGDGDDVKCQNQIYCSVCSDCRAKQQTFNCIHISFGRQVIAKWYDMVNGRSGGVPWKLVY